MLNRDHKGDMVEFQVKSILRKSLFSLLYSPLDNMNGLLQTKTSNAKETLDWVLDLFPVLKERLRQRAGTLSGGEQQMLATARALCSNPRLLLMDEPGEGLMPSLVQRLLETISTLKDHQVGVLLVEQKIDAAFKVADRVALMENGSIRYQSTPTELTSNPEILIKYVGIRR